MRLFILIVFSVVAGTNPATAQSKADVSADVVVPDASSHPMQGQCGSAITPDANVATSSCPGVSQSPMTLVYPSLTDACIYIDNSSPQTSYFVPIRTSREWLAFKAAVGQGSMKDVSLAYGCKADSVTAGDTCGGSTQLPQARNGTTISWSNPATGFRATYTCVANSGCGHWQANVLRTASCKPVPNTTPTTTTTIDTTATIDTTTASSCTASPEICNLYASNLGRLPDQSGSAYWQGQYDALVAQGLTASQIDAQLNHAMSGNAEAQNYAANGQANSNVGFLATNTTQAQSPSCVTGSVDCTANPGTVTKNTIGPIDGWNNVQNIISSSYVSNGITSNLDASSMSYWTAQYNQALASGQTPDQAAQNVANAISTAAAQNAGP